jgi:uncharacterized membrane protein YkvA (DUF1232 family)
VSDTVVTIELNPRDRRLYDRVRAQLARVEPGAASGFRDVLLLMPDLTVLMARLLRDPRVPRSAKLVALLGVGYVLSPVDLLPGLIFGPVGLLDDALVVAATLSRLVNDVHPDIVRSLWPGKGDALEAIQRVTGWAQSLFGTRLRGALRGLVGRGPGAAARRSP